MIRFGTGGVPLTSPKRDTASGIKYLSSLGLQHMELEFVQSVYVKEEAAPEIKAAAEEANITLTAHGSYFTNFASPEPAKFYASIQRTGKAITIGELCGLKSVTFHSGFMQGASLEAVTDRIVDGLIKLADETKGVQVKISPELTGKESQFGSLPQLISMLKKLEDKGYKDRFRFCLDFAHNHARFNGIFATEGEYRAFFDTIIKELGEEYLQNLHMHMSAIHFGDKGEKNHLTLLPSFASYKSEYGIDIPEMEPNFAELIEKNKLGGGKQDWKALLKVLKEYKVSGYFVCESPVLEYDALIYQKVYNEI